MLSWIDWPVLTRQLLLVLVPVLVAKGIVPDYLASPLVDLVSYLIGTLIVGAVIAWGQRRERPEIKIAETAALPEVETIALHSDALAAAIPSGKVIS